MIISYIIIVKFPFSSWKPREKRACRLSGLPPKNSTRATRLAPKNFTKLRRRRSSKYRYRSPWEGARRSCSDTELVQEGILSPQNLSGVLCPPHFQARSREQEGKLQQQEEKATQLAGAVEERCACIAAMEQRVRRMEEVGGKTTRFGKWWKKYF